jgi:uncharacterized membrane protein YvbJ
MALTTCPKCGKTVSDRALKCPHCGYNLKEGGFTEIPNKTVPKAESPATPIIEKKGSPNMSGEIVGIILLVIVTFAIIVMVSLGYLFNG